MVTPQRKDNMFAGQAWDKKLLWTLLKMQSQVRFTAWYF